MHILFLVVMCKYHRPLTISIIFFIHGRPLETEQDSASI